MLPANHDLRVVDDVHHEHQRANAAVDNLEDLRETRVNGYGSQAMGADLPFSKTPQRLTDESA